MHFILFVLLFTAGNKQAFALDVRKDILAPLHTVEDGEDAGRVSFEVKERPKIDAGAHTEFQFVFAKGKMGLRLSVDGEAIKNPRYLVREAALYSCLRYPGCMEIPGIKINDAGALETLATRISLYSVSELLDNMRAGNLSAKLRWLRWKFEVLSRTTVTNDFEKQFPGTRDYLASQLKDEKRMLADLENEAQAQEEAAALAQERQYQQTREALERDLLRLKSMLAANDRKGVAAFFRNLLPWKEFQPVETTTWRRWLEAIESPNRAKSILAFRGVSHKEMLAAEVNGKYVFRSALLGRMRAGESIVTRLLGAREFYGDLERSQGTRSGELAVRIADQMYAHAEAMVPEKFGHSSIFMSFTPMLDVAEQFVSGSETMPGEPGGLLAVRVDDRRMVSNLTGFNREIELLAPLVIFADEVVHFQPNYRYSDSSHQKFLSELRKRGEKYSDDGSEIEALDFQGRGFEFFRLMRSGR